MSNSSFASQTQVVFLAAQLAELAAKQANINAMIDLGWLVLTGSIVFFMQLGFALCEAGSMRSKNTAAVLLKNVIDFCVGAILWYFFGYAFAYGKSENPNNFIGDARFALKDAPTAEYATWFFQFTFCATAATIVSGAVGERIKFTAYLVYTCFITGFIYPVVLHAAWSDVGWISPFNPGTTRKVGDPMHGVIDFAGSGVVHLVGGIAALVGCISVGPRRGRFDEKTGEPKNMPGHSATLSCIGTLILFFAWYSFNCGSTLKLSGNGGELAARAAMTTTIAGCLAGVSGLLVSAIASRFTVWDISVTLNSIIFGLVAVTAGCTVFDPWGAFIVGTLSGPLYFGFSTLLLKLKIDDPTDASAIHGGGGIFGLLFPGFLAMPKPIMESYAFEPRYAGVFCGGSGIQLGYQLLFLVFVICWSGALTGLLFFVITKTIGVRVSPADEDRGMDVHHTSHGFAYDYLEMQAPTGSPKYGDPPAQPPVELPVQPHQPNVEMSAFPGATNQ